jgi:hypothetical protein
MGIIWIDFTPLNVLDPSAIVFRVGRFELFLIKGFSEEDFITCLQLVIDLTRFSRLEAIELVERFIVS